MDVLIVLVFVSLVLVTGSIVLFLYTVRQRDFEHGDRLSLLPLLESTAAKDSSRAEPAQGENSRADVPGSPESTRS